MALDVATIKKDFPILDQQVHGRRLVYLEDGRPVPEAGKPPPRAGASSPPSQHGTTK